MRRHILMLGLAWASAGTACGNGSADGAGGGDAAPTAPASPVTTIAGCPLIYAQEIFPTFEIEVSDAVWNQLLDDVGQGWTRYLAGEDPHPSYPLQSFRYEGFTATDATIRLRGNPRWWVTQKMQFQISFNDSNPAGRFMGLRKIALDCGKDNKSLLRDRLALHFLRDLGVPAPCANNARLVVNGAYYGVYTNVEKIDKEFLQRSFGKANDDGDLWKRKDWVIQTNETMPDLAAIEAFKHPTSVADLCAMADCDEMIAEWAGEAVLPDTDGAWAGQVNYYVYGHPTRGFLVLPWDFDFAFTTLPFDTDPITWVKPGREAERPQYTLLLADASWRQKYLDALAKGVAVYDVPTMQGRVDVWSAQIEQAVLDDPSKMFENEQFYQAVGELRAFLALRHDFLVAWLAND